MREINFGSGKFLTEIAWGESWEICVDLMKVCRLLVRLLKFKKFFWELLKFVSIFLNFSSNFPYFFLFFFSFSLKLSLIFVTIFLLIFSSIFPLNFPQISLKFFSKFPSISLLKSSFETQIAQKSTSP